jgi:16S rRNA G527 N7-methylase RsmG
MTLDDLLALYQSEVLRWNRQFSLMTRHEPEARLQAMVQECLAAAISLPEALMEWQPGLATLLGAGGAVGRRQSIPPVLVYCDIGAGAGLPGLVWHAWLERALGPALANGRITLRTFLLEGRSKRAWFLGRMVGLLGLNGVEVCAQRWGKVASILPGLQDALVAGPVLWIVTLRALKMSDIEVLQGWLAGTGLGRLAPADELLIGRFRGPSARLSPSLRKSLGWPASSGPDLEVAPGFTARGWKIHACKMGGRPRVSLALSCYRGSGGSHP